jgi:hypothetical protein
MLSKKKSFGLQKLASAFFMMSAALQVFSQTTLKDYVFLIGSDKEKVSVWAEAVSEAERINVCRYFLDSGKRQFGKAEFIEAEKSFEFLSNFSKYPETSRLVAESYYEAGVTLYETEGWKSNEKMLNLFVKAQEELKKHPDTNSKIVLAKTLLQITDIKTRTVFDDSFPTLSYINEARQIADQTDSALLKGLAYK